MYSRNLQLGVITINLNYCGFHYHNVNQDVIFRPKGLAYNLFLIVLAPMRFIFSDGTSQLTEKGACIFYTPGTFQLYEAEDVFFNSFVEFSLEGIDTYSFPRNQIFYPSNHEKLNQIINNICEEYHDGQSHSLLMIERYLIQLCVELTRQFENARHKNADSNLYLEFLSVRQTMLRECNQNWSIDRLCKMLNIGKSQFYKRYRAFFHSSPKEELLQARLQAAIFSMTNESLNIKESAYQAGFQNISHFNRLFRRYMGCSPSEYPLRKQD